MMYGVWCVVCVVRGMFGGVCRVIYSVWYALCFVWCMPCCVLYTMRCVLCVVCCALLCGGMYSMMYEFCDAARFVMGCVLYIAQWLLYWKLCVVCCALYVVWCVMCVVFRVG